MMARKQMRWLAPIAALLMLLTFPMAAMAKTVLVYGDSLLAGYGLPQADGFQAQLKADRVRGNYVAKTRHSALLNPRLYGAPKHLPSPEGGARDGT